MKIFDTGVNSAEENMRIDTALLDELTPDGEPILHLYDWTRPSLTHGYFINPSEHLRMEELHARQFDWARRPTGGGIVFHCWDLAFSLLLPANHPSYSPKPVENYRFINQLALHAFRELFPLPMTLLPQKTPHANAFCMAMPTQYDLLHGAQKLAGAAQRRKRGGLLHQGTLSLATPDRALLGALLLSENTIQNILSTTCSPLGVCSNLELSQARLELKNNLILHFLAGL